MRILMVDPDEPLIRLAARFFSEVDGVSVETARTADQALALVTATPPDVVITELRLPDGDGIALKEAILSQGYSVPVVLYTGGSPPDQIIRALNAGIDRFLTKSRDPVIQFPFLLRTITDVVTGRQDKETKQKAHEELLCGDLLNGLPLPVLELDEEGNTTFVNDRAVEMFGYSRPEYTGMPVSKLLAHDEKGRVPEHVWWTLRGALPVDEEYQAVRHDGSTFWGLFSFFPVQIGGLPGLRVMVVDITRKKEMEQKYRENEERLNLAIESASLSIWDWDLETGILKSTGQSAEALSAPFEQLQGHVNAIEDLINPEDLPGLMKRAQRHFVEKTPFFETRFRVRGDNGEWRWIQMRGRVIARDDRGLPRKMTGIYQDVTEEANRERLIRERAAQFRTLFYNMNCGGAIFRAVDGGRDFVVMDINYAGEVIEGKKKHALAGKGISELYAGDEYTILSDAMLQVWQTGKPRSVDRLAFKRGKEPRWREYYFYSLPTGEMIAIYNDITERIERQKEILSSLKVKETLIKEIHHRVKNNLQVIASILKLQALRTEDPKAVEVLRDCRNRVFSIAMIHEELYRSEHLASIHVVDYIRRLGEHLIYEFLAVSPPVSLTVDCDESIDLDLDTGIPCGLIIDELVTNALKYAFRPGDHGSIRIVFTRHEDGYELRVSDSGVGFPADVDFRETDTLGMQLVTNLVEQLSGTIELVRGHGTEFIIRFPAPGRKKKYYR
jgi:PAS domain S-box-containing protein